MASEYANNSKRKNKINTLYFKIKKFCSLKDVIKNTHTNHKTYNQQNISTQNISLINLYE